MRTTPRRCCAAVAGRVVCRPPKRSQQIDCDAHDNLPICESAIPKANSFLRPNRTVCQHEQFTPHNQHQLINDSLHAHRNFLSASFPPPPISIASNHFQSADDYVLSSALAQLQQQHGHLQHHQQQNTMMTTAIHHLYDETPRAI